MVRIRIGRAVALLCLIAVGAAAQGPENPAPATGRLDQRIQALQQEAERLAGTARTLVNELSALEVERDLRRAEALKADAAVQDAQQLLNATSQRLADLEAQRVAQLPGLKRQLVEMYKRGRLGYTAMVLGAGSVREFGRTTRVVAAMATLNQKRIEEHLRTIESLRREREALAARTRSLEEQQAAAGQARLAAERAVAAHAGRIAQIDARRDLAAQYAGELQVARQTLFERLGDRPAGEAGAVPLAPFRGALEWPVDGRVSGQFGESSNRLGGPAVRNGIEILAEEGRPVRAVHGGTVVHAGTFAGLGSLVILDHGGDDYSLYGYLGGIAVSVGQAVDAGAELGQVGLSPAGPPALYMEMRIDGRAVDPVQWLKPR